MSHNDTIFQSAKSEIQKTNLVSTFLYTSFKGYTSGVPGNQYSFYYKTSYGYNPFYTQWYIPITSFQGIDIGTLVGRRIYKITANVVMVNDNTQAVQWTMCKNGTEQLFIDKGPLGVSGIGDITEILPISSIFESNNFGQTILQDDINSYRLAILAPYIFQLNSTTTPVDGAPILVEAAARIDFQYLP